MSVRPQQYRLDPTLEESTAAAGECSGSPVSAGALAPSALAMRTPALTPALLLGPPGTAAAAAATCGGASCAGGAVRRENCKAPTRPNSAPCSATRSAAIPSAAMPHDPFAPPPTNHEVGLPCDDGGGVAVHRAPPKLATAPSERSSTRAKVAHALAHARDDKHRLRVLHTVLNAGPREWWALPLALASQSSGHAWEDDTVVGYACLLHGAAAATKSLEARQTMVRALRPHPMLTALVALLASDAPAMLEAARRCSGAETRQISRIALSSAAADDSTAAGQLELNMALWFSVLRDVELQHVVASAVGGISVPGHGVRLQPQHVPQRGALTAALMGPHTTSKPSGTSKRTGAHPVMRPAPVRPARSPQHPSHQLQPHTVSIGSALGSAVGSHAPSASPQRIDVGRGSLNTRTHSVILGGGLGGGADHAKFTADARDAQSAGRAPYRGCEADKRHHLHEVW